MDKERRGHIVPFAPFKDLRDAQRRQQIVAVRAEARHRLQSARERLEHTSEDAYDTRNQLHTTINFLSWFNGKVTNTAPGSTVDLRRTIIEYGYDPEDEAAYRESGLSYVSDADREAAEYERHIGALRPLLRELEASGVRVQTGIKRKLPPEEFDEDR